MEGARRRLSRRTLESVSSASSTNVRLTLDNVEDRARLRSIGVNLPGEDWVSPVRERAMGAPPPRSAVPKMRLRQRLCGGPLEQPPLHALRRCAVRP